MIPATMITKDRLEFDPIIPEDERRFYQKAYTNVNLVRERKVHCTVCKMHIGTAPSNESLIRMHPILRVTHCKKCHEFYNSGEFSKGEDGSELYCRWCGQGGEVYCCSNCPFVFCKSCIISNLSRGVVADIEQNENWSCFNCAPKMLWPLRAQHWALMKFIDKQKKAILNSNLTDAEIKTQMTKDRSLCCKIKIKAAGYATDSSESSDISLTKLKHKSAEKRCRKSLPKEDIPLRMSPVLPKKAKPNNDEVVCTPDVMSMLEPECQLTVAPSAKTNQQPTASIPKIMSITQPKRPSPPPIVIRNAQSQQVRAAGPTPVVKKTVVGPRLPAATGGDFTTPVYHTINGYRIDLNSAAQQETVRLPNGKLIQVKRQGTGPQTVTTVQSAPNTPSTPTRVIQNAVSPSFPNQQIVHSSGGHIIRAQLQTPRSITVQNSVLPQFQQQTPQQFQQITIRQPNQPIATIRYQGASNQQVTNIIQNGTVQLLNGTAVTTSGGQVATVRQVPTFVKQLFPNTPLGLTRNQLQNQICSAMDICQHLMNKVQTLTNSNAYKTAKSLTDVKELYIHLSYLLTYAIGRFKGLQDNCLSDMRDLGFTTDANSLENGQLAAGEEMVRTGIITDFVNTPLVSFHDLVLENMEKMASTPADPPLTTEEILNYTPEQNDLESVEIINDREKVVEKDADCESIQWPKIDIADDDDNNVDIGVDNDNDNDNANASDIDIGVENHINNDNEDENYIDIDNESDIEADNDTYLIESSTDIESIEDSEDDLLIECGERQPDECKSPSPVNDRNSDTISENGSPERVPKSIKGFTHDLDTKLIELVKEKPTLWDPTHDKYTGGHQSKAWKEIARNMPKGLNCRMRWKSIKYSYLRYQKRSAHKQTRNKQVPPHRNAFLLKFLDKVPTKSASTTSKQTVLGPDDHDLIVKLIGVVKNYPSLWHSKSIALIRHTSQPEVWKKVMNDLQDDKYKQASDAEEDEITIVEPKTDTITLDSDNEEESSASVQRPSAAAQQSVIKSNSNVKSSIAVIKPVSTSLAKQSALVTPTTTTNENNEITTQFDFTNILAGMLDVDITEHGNNGVSQPKKPRKKTTNKPNPTLLKQKEIQERERLENLKKNDAKLKMQVQIPLNKVEEIYQYAKPLVDELKCEKLEEIEMNEEEECIDKSADSKLKDNPKDEIAVNNELEVTKKDEVNSHADDKDESEEVVVVVVRDLENSKEQENSKNDTEGNKESVELIEQGDEHEELDDDQSKEDSQSQEDDLTKGEDKNQKEDEKLKQSENENEKSEKQAVEEKEKNSEACEKLCEELETDQQKDENLLKTQEVTPEVLKKTKDTVSKENKEDKRDTESDSKQDDSKQPPPKPIEKQSLEKEAEGSTSSNPPSNTLNSESTLSRTEAVESV